MRHFESTAKKMVEIFGSLGDKLVMSIDNAESLLVADEYLREELKKARSDKKVFGFDRAYPFISLNYEVKSEKFYIEVFYSEDRNTKRFVNIENTEWFFAIFAARFRKDLIEDAAFRQQALDKLVGDYIDSCVSSRR